MVHFEIVSEDNLPNPPGRRSDPYPFRTIQVACNFDRCLRDGSHYGIIIGYTGEHARIIWDGVEDWTLETLDRYVIL